MCTCLRASLFLTSTPIHTFMVLQYLLLRPRQQGLVYIFTSSKRNIVFTLMRMPILVVSFAIACTPALVLQIVFALNAMNDDAGAS